MTDTAAAIHLLLWYFIFYLWSEIFTLCCGDTVITLEWWHKAVISCNSHPPDSQSKITISQSVVPPLWLTESPQLSSIVTIVGDQCASVVWWAVISANLMTPWVVSPCPLSSTVWPLRLTGRIIVSATKHCIASQSQLSTAPLHCDTDN